MRKLSLAFCCLTVITLLMTSCNSCNRETTDTKDSVDSVGVVPKVDETQAISEVTTRFARAYLNQDNQKANALIHPDLGLYVIYRPGAMDTYEHVDSLDFSKPVPEHFPYTSFENNYVLTFEQLPTYDCGGEKWDKLGFFCDTTQQANQLTQIAKFKQEFGELDAQGVADIQALENDSYRVILTHAENLIFHVKKHEGAWYVFVLDRAYGWCDA